MFFDDDDDDDDDDDASRDRPLDHGRSWNHDIPELSRSDLKKWRRDLPLMFQCAERCWDYWAQKIRVWVRIIPRNEYQEKKWENAASWQVGLRFLETLLYPHNNCALSHKYHKGIGYSTPIVAKNPQSPTTFLGISKRLGPLSSSTPKRSVCMSPSRGSSAFSYDSCEKPRDVAPLFFVHISANVSKA